jgi:hypothetical protein
VSWLCSRTLADDRLLFAREHDPATGYDELVVRQRDR